MTSYKSDKGALVISLDFEKYWGMRDKKSVDAYRSNLEGVDEVVDRTLSLFQEYGIRATWATVGFLFCKNFEELTAALPEQKPAYANAILDPYDYISQQNASSLEPSMHFASEGIQKIVNTPGQELSTHTHSHFYFLEEGIDPDTMRADLETFKSMAADLGQSTDSIVFPRNQYNDQTLTLLAELGIRVYRGNEQSWLYRPSKDEEQTKLRRLIRLVDSMINVSGHHTATPQKNKELINIPSSRFLRPVSGKFGFMNKLQTSRIKGSMKHAAKNGEVFHLWWHPHNFGTRMDQNFDRLREVLDYQQHLKESHGFQSLNMQDFIEG